MMLSYYLNKKNLAIAKKLPKWFKILPITKLALKILQKTFQILPNLASLVEHKLANSLPTVDYLMIVNYNTMFNFVVSSCHNLK